MYFSSLRPFTIDWVITLGYHSFNPPNFSFFGDLSPRRIFTPTNGLFLLVWGKKSSRSVEFILTNPHLHERSILVSLSPSIAPLRGAASVMALNVQENVLIMDFIALLQILMVFGLFVHAALDEEKIEIPEDVIREMVLQAVD